MERKAAKIENKDLLEKRRAFLKRIESHILSNLEYSQGMSQENLQISKAEYKKLIKEGVIIRDQITSKAQAVLFVSFQEKPLYISISSNDAVIVDDLPKKKINPKKRLSGPVHHGEILKERKGLLDVIKGLLSGEKNK
jgi:hypothetical protein